MQIVLTDGQYKNWFSSSYIVNLTIISAAASVLFVITELIVENPAVNIKVLKDINLSANSFLSMVFSLGIFGSLFLLPMFLQKIMGYSAYDAGIAIMSRGLAMVISMPLTGRLFNKVGPKILVFIGFILSIISSIQIGSMSLNMGFWDVFWPQFTQGLGFGLIIVSLMTSSLITLENKYKIDGAGLFNLIRQVAGSIGIAVLATMIDNNTQMAHSVLAQNVSDNTQTMLSLRRAAQITHSFVFYPPAKKVLALINGMITQQSTMIAFNLAFIFMAVCFAVSIPVIFLLKGSKSAKDKNGSSSITLE
jgi:DHA2 family multidrug resistance protein